MVSKPSTVSTGSSPGSALWEFDHGHGAMPWASATAPDVTALQQIRGIPSRRGAGHVPTFAFSVTVGAHLRLESGLEHDLVRELDRRPDVMWLVAQPAKIRVVRERDKRVWHVPDLLSVADDSHVTVWDVRPTGRRDDAFWEVAEASKEACRALGWGYELFGGMSTVRRTNLMWLDGYRREMPWYRAALEEFTSVPDEADRFELRAVLRADGGEGHLLSAIWFAIRRGLIDCDLNLPIRPDTTLTWPDREMPT